MRRGESDRSTFTGTVTAWCLPVPEEVKRGNDEAAELSGRESTDLRGGSNEQKGGERGAEGGAGEENLLGLKRENRENMID